MYCIILSITKFDYEKHFHFTNSLGRVTYENMATTLQNAFFLISFELSNVLCTAVLHNSSQCKCTTSTFNTELMTLA